MNQNPAVRVNGYAIRAFRQQARYTQGEFADMAGVSNTHLSQIERERQLPSLLTVYRIAHGLGVPVAAITREPADINDADFGAPAPRTPASA